MAASSKDFARAQALFTPLSLTVVKADDFAEFSSNLNELLGMIDAAVSSASGARLTTNAVRPTNKKASFIGDPNQFSPAFQSFMKAWKDLIEILSPWNALHDLVLALHETAVSA